MEQKNTARDLVANGSVHICHIISSYYPLIGGAERATQNLCQGLVAQGYDIEVLTTWYPDLSRCEIINGVNVRRVGLGGIGKVRSLFFGIHLLWYIILYSRSASLIHAQNIDTPLLTGMLLKLVLRKPLITTINSDKAIPTKQNTLPGRFRLWFVRRLVDKITAVSRSGQTGLIQAGISPDRIALIPNGMNTDYFRPPTPEEKRALREQHTYDPKDVIVLSLGRLIPSKRVDLLLEALSELKHDAQVKCIIVGDGPEKRALQDMSEHLGLADRVEFVGATDKVRDFYWLSDIFVQPSQFEGLSVALLESMSCGMTVLVSRCAGNLDAVIDGENGLTFPVDDAQQLADRLRKLVLDPAYYSALGKCARSRVEEEYSIPVVTGAHLNIYKTLLGDGKYARR